MTGIPNIPFVISVHGQVPFDMCLFCVKRVLCVWLCSHFVSYEGSATSLHLGTDGNESF